MCCFSVVPLIENSDGIGLAATQVNQHLQVVVMDVPDSGEDYQLILYG
jgi:peptide deformylase